MLAFNSPHWGTLGKSRIQPMNPLTERCPQLSGHLRHDQYLASRFGMAGISTLGVNDSFGPTCSIPHWGLDTAFRCEQMCSHRPQAIDQQTRRILMGSP